MIVTARCTCLLNIRRTEEIIDEQQALKFQLYLRYNMISSIRATVDRTISTTCMLCSATGQPVHHIGHRIKHTIIDS
jgi:hypothetical protein